jgi:hypothetical protein
MAILVPVKRKRGILTSLLDEVFVISRIIKVEVSRLSVEPKARLVTLTETLVIRDITKTEFNNCFIIHCISLITLSQ